MPAYRVALVATLLACLSTRRAAAAAAPTVESDGPDLTLKCGDGGDVSLASPDVVVTLAQLSQALADIVRTRENAVSPASHASVRMRSHPANSHLAPHPTPD